MFFTGTNADLSFNTYVYIETDYVANNTKPQRTCNKITTKEMK